VCHATKPWTDGERNRRRHSVFIGHHRSGKEFVKNAKCHGSFAAPGYSAGRYPPLSTSPANEAAQSRALPQKKKASGNSTVTLWPPARTSCVSPHHWTTSPPMTDNWFIGPNEWIKACPVNISILSWGHANVVHCWRVFTRGKLPGGRVVIGPIYMVFSGWSWSSWTMRQCSTRGEW
jgi:hypothetical protein